MRLVEVVEDATMLVSGYEHQTWQCSGCSSVERRMTFSREKRQTHKVPVTDVASLEPTQTAAAELARTAPVESTPIVPIQAIQTAQAEPSQSSLVEMTVSVEATHEPPLQQSSHSQPPATMLQTNVSQQPFDEKLRKFMERATALKEAAAKAKRDVQFNRDWDKLRSAPSPSALSTARSQMNRDEPVRSPVEPAAALVPTAHEEPVNPGSERARRWNWRELLRLGRHKSL
jgi:hypothetical protein